MASTLADLLVRLGLNSAEYTQGLKKAERDMHNFASVTAEAAKRIEHLLEFEVIVHGAEQAFEFLKGAAESAERFGKMAQSVGIPVEALQRLGAAARMADISNEQLGTGLAKLSRNMAKADADSGEAARAFEYLGIATTDAAGNIRAPLDVYLDIADAFANAEDGAGKTALAIMLLGRAGAEHIPVLNKGRDGINEEADAAQRLGRILSAETVRGAEEFSDALKRMGGGAKALGAMIAAELSEPLNELIRQMNEGRDSASSMRTAAEDIAGVLKFVAGSALSAAMSIGFVGKSVMQVVDMARHIAKGEFPTFAVLQKNDKDMEAYVAKWMGMLRALDSKSKATDPQEVQDRAGRQKKILKPPPAVAALKDAKDETEKLLADILKMVDEAQMKLDTFGQGKTAEIQWRIEKGDVGKKLSELVFSGKLPAAQVGEYAAQLVKLTAEYEKLESDAKAAEKAQRDLDAMMREGAQVTADVRTPTEQFAATQRRLEELLAGGAITWETYGRAVKKAEADLKLAQLSKNALAQDLTNGLQGAIEDAFNGGRIDEAFGNLLKRLIAKAAAEEIMLQLGFEIRGQSGGKKVGFDALKDIFGLFGGGGQTSYTPTSFDPGLFTPDGGQVWDGAFAGGGTAHAGGAYLVGEQGPELFVPGTTGTVVPNDQISSGGSVVQNFNFHGTLIDRAAVENFARQYRGQISKGMRG